MKRRINPAWFFLSPVLAVIALLVVFPMFFSLYLSLTDLTLTAPTTRFVGLQNYVNIIFDPDFQYSLVVTGLYISTILSAEFLFGLGLAFILVRQFRGIKLVRAFIVAPMMMLPATVGITWGFIYRPDIGVIDFFLRRLGLPQVNFLSDPALALL